MCGNPLVQVHVVHKYMTLLSGKTGESSTMTSYERNWDILSAP